MEITWKNSPNLGELSFEGNNISDEGLESLTEVITTRFYPRLQHINLIDNRITESGAEFLANNLTSDSLPRILQFYIGQPYYAYSLSDDEEIYVYDGDFAPYFCGLIHTNQNMLHLSGQHTYLEYERFRGEDIYNDRDICAEIKHGDILQEKGYYKAAVGQYLVAYHLITKGHFMRKRIVDALGEKDTQQLAESLIEKVGKVIDAQPEEFLNYSLFQRVMAKWHSIEKDCLETVCSEVAVDLPNEIMGQVSEMIPFSDKCATLCELIGKESLEDMFCSTG